MKKALTCIALVYAMEIHSMAAIPIYFTNMRAPNTPGSLINSIDGDPGDFIFNEDTGQMHVMDGSAKGGGVLATRDISSIFVHMSTNAATDGQSLSAAVTNAQLHTMSSFGGTGTVVLDVMDISSNGTSGYMLSSPVSVSSPVRIVSAQTVFPTGHEYEDQMYDTGRMIACITTDGSGPGIVIDQSYTGADPIVFDGIALFCDITNETDGAVSGMVFNNCHLDGKLYAGTLANVDASFVMSPMAYFNNCTFGTNFALIGRNGTNDTGAMFATATYSKCAFLTKPPYAYTNSFYGCTFFSQALPWGTPYGTNEYYEAVVLMQDCSLEDAANFSTEGFTSYALSSLSQTAIYNCDFTSSATNLFFTSAGHGSGFQSSLSDLNLIINNADGISSDILRMTGFLYFNCVDNTGKRWWQRTSFSTTEQPTKTVVPGKSTATAYTVGTTNPAEAYGGFVIVSGTCKITLPAAIAGMSVTIKSRGAVTVSVNPNGTETIYLDGASVGAGDEIDSNGATGETVTLVCVTAGEWDATSDGWIDGGP